ncbi:unnamed protein product [Arctogadus glacialis]
MASLPTPLRSFISPCSWEPVSPSSPGLSGTGSAKPSKNGSGHSGGSHHTLTQFISRRTKGVNGTADRPQGETSRGLKNGRYSSAGHGYAVHEDISEAHTTKTLSGECLSLARGHWPMERDGVLYRALSGSGCPNEMISLRLRGPGPNELQLLSLQSFSKEELSEVSTSHGRRSASVRDDHNGSNGGGLSSAAERFRKQTTVRFGYCTLSLAMRGLDDPPMELWELRELEKLNLSINCLRSLPPALGGMDNLVVLNLWGNNLASLPPEIGQLKKLRVLFAYRNCLSEVPEELGSCSSLEVLSLADNRITALPESLASMRNLTKLNLSNNRMAHIPTCVYSMKGLVFLHLACNRLEVIADQIQDLVNLKILIVEGNSLHSLPKTLCFLESLELLNVDFNDLQSVPGEMYLMSGLRKLACHPLDKGLHIIHNPLVKPIKEVLQGGLSALYNYLKPS